MMDLQINEDDWEYLPDAATYHRLLLHHDSDDDRPTLSFPLRSPPSVLNMDYFSTTTDSNLPPLIPLQFPPNPALLHPDDEDQQEMEEDVNINNNKNNKVFFKSGFVSKEAIESVDMKFLDSSSSPTAASKFDDLFSEDQVSRSLALSKSDHQTAKVCDDVNWIGEGIIGDDYIVDADDGGIISGLNLWKLGFGGFGAICSFGVAAATLCLILLGNSHKAQQNHKLRYQIYSADDQRMKQVVEQATKFNEAMSAAVKGVPLNRAHISYGGYYDNAL